MKVPVFFALLGLAGVVFLIYLGVRYIYSIYKKELAAYQHENNWYTVAVITEKVQQYRINEGKHKNIDSFSMRIILKQHHNGERALEVVGPSHVPASTIEFVKTMESYLLVACPWKEGILPTESLHKVELENIQFPGLLVETKPVAA